MSSGLPVVTSKNRGTSDIIVNGVEGITCDYNSTQQFADAIKLLKNNNGLVSVYGDNNLKNRKEYIVNVKNIILAEMYNNS